MFKPCIIIPVYNHWEQLTRITEQLTHQNLPCLLINDGSSHTCHQILIKLANNNPLITLTDLSANMGKGAAVCLGIKQAHKLGYSHCLQIDADGQHNLEDINAFLNLAKENPQDVISGHRPYQEMPAKRRYGRLITDIWVWINTLSFTIKDSMCGYRVYPVSATQQLISENKICARMDFDTDIIVRLYWQGLNVQHIPTHVYYDESIQSHFKVWRDNLRISLMHARLFLGMLPRAPKLLSRKASS